LEALVRAKGVYAGAVTDSGAAPASESA
jgi:hypothetical protein